jgi:hypothetical protein
VARNPRPIPLTCETCRRDPAPSAALFAAEVETLAGVGIRARAEVIAAGIAGSPARGGRDGSDKHEPEQQRAQGQDPRSASPMARRIAMRRDATATFKKGRTMRRIGLDFVVALLALGPAWAEDVPFAKPPVSESGQSPDLMQPGLGDIMSLAQLRHIKLWQAGKSANWALVDYEIDKLQNSFSRAAMLYNNIPLAYIAMIGEPLNRLKAASSEKNFTKFASGFSELTAACNSCHVAGNVRFIRIQAPTASPFSDQNFAPEK